MSIIRWSRKLQHPIQQVYGIDEDDASMSQIVRMQGVPLGEVGQDSSAQNRVAKNFSQKNLIRRPRRESFTTTIEHKV